MRRKPTWNPPVDAPPRIPGLPLSVYVLLLSLVSELLAATAFGLIASWGERFPHRLPFLGGRPVPALPVVLLAAAGAGVLTLLWTWTAVTAGLGRRIDGSRAGADRILQFGNWHGWVAAVAYAPLLLWGPLLAALTWAYWRRRTRRPAARRVAGAPAREPADASV